MLVASLAAHADEQQLAEAEAATEADPEQALAIVSTLLERESLAPMSRLRALIVSCQAGVRVIGPKAALDHCEQAVTLAELEPDETYLLRARNVRGTAFYGLGRVTNAFADFSAAFAMARTLGDLRLTSRLANNLGVVTRNSGAFEQATDYFHESIQLAQSTGYHYMEAVASINLGDSYTELERFEGAYPYFEQALLAAKRTQDDTLSLHAHISIAETLTKQGRPSQAIAHLEPLIASADARRRNVAVAGAYEVLARAHSDLDRKSEAIGHLGTALDIAEELHAVRLRDRLLIEFARLQHLDGNFNDALATIAVPIQRARQQGNDLILRAGLREQTRILAALQRPEQALASDQEADALEQAFNTRRANEQLSMLRVSAEQEKTARQLAQALQQRAETEMRVQRDQRVRNTALIALVFLLGLGYLWHSRRRSVELEHLVVERTRALEDQIAARAHLEQQLAQSKKLEAIGKLTGGIAHDFNNLLTVINGTLDLLRTNSENRLSEQDAALIDDALAAVRSGASITQQLLAFARKQQLRPEKFDLTTHVKDLERLLTRSLGSPRRLVVTAPPEPIWVCLDRGQLTTALLNLVLNAHDATPEDGTVNIDISSRTIGAKDTNVLEPGLYARIAVTDNGRGMTADELQQACEPFFSTKSFSAGAGLGLSMVYGFVKQSAGDLVISSEFGKGTKVEFVVPVTADEAIAAEADSNSDRDDWRQGSPPTPAVET